MSSMRKQTIDSRELAEILGVKLSWVSRRTMPKARDPIPRCPGFGRPRFNPRDPRFKEWVERNFGPIDFDSPDLYTRAESEGGPEGEN